MFIHTLSEADVRAVLTMDVAIAAVEASFRKVALDEATAVPRQRCQTDHVMLHVLPASAKTLNALGFKAYTTGRFATQFHVYLFDPLRGALSAIISADYLGQVRTGAASAVATRLLARPEATRLGVYGSGGQARTQLEAVARVSQLSRVCVFSRDAVKRAKFCTEMSAALQLDVVPVDTPEQAARNQDIIITATTSREPVLHGDWIAPGTHLNIMGSNQLSKAEIDIAAVTKCSLITIDSKEQGRQECGDFKAALDANALHWSDVKEFAAVLVGRYPGRTSESEITMFKSLGLGVQDIAVAVPVLAEAKRRGLGHTVELGS